MPRARQVVAVEHSWLIGLRSMIASFNTLTDRIPQDCRRNRSVFLVRLLVSWSGVYIAVAPVMIWTLWRRFAG